MVESTQKDKGQGKETSTRPRRAKATSPASKPQGESAAAQSGAAKSKPRARRASAAAGDGAAPANPAAPTRKSAAGDMDAIATRRTEPGSGMSAERRRAMIAELAYLRAERRGFVGGDPVADWLEGEKEVDRLLGRQAS